MYRKTFLASLACLFALPFAAAQSADESKGTPTTESPVDLDLIDSLATPTPSSTTCTGLYSIRLDPDTSSTYPYLRLSINGEPYRFAIALGQTESYIFSQELCASFLSLGGTRSGSTCLPAGSGEPERKSINFHNYRLDYANRNLKVDFALDISRPISIQDFAFREVLSVDASLPDFLSKYGHADGIIGLSKLSQLLKGVVKETSKFCAVEAGFGIRMANSDFLVFGGIDVKGNTFETPDSPIIDESSQYEDASIQVVGSKGEDLLTQPVTIQFDSAAIQNFIPQNLMSNLSQFRDRPDVGIAIKIGQTIFATNLASLAPQQTFTDSIGLGQTAGTSSPNQMITLGAPFFFSVYAALIPGQNGLKFSSDDGELTQVFKPFKNIDALKAENSQTNKDDDDNDSGADINGGAKGTEEPHSFPAPNSPPIGVIVGGVVGGVVFLAAVVIGGCCFWRKKKGRSSARSIEKEYEADFDAEIGHDVGILPHFTKESGYAHLPTPPPPPSSQTYADSQYLHPSTEYLPPVRPYSDESPLRSHNGSPAPLVVGYPVPVPTERSPFSHEDDSPQRSHHDEDNDNIGALNQHHQDRRVSVANTVSTLTDIPSPMISRNVSTVSRREYPAISQIQTRSVLPQHDEDEDDDDAVSIRSGPGYQYRSSAPSVAAPPRLPFARPENERSDSPL